ncbi:hypothetical protein [Winogradskyella algicola]|uniref:hypothetical protein n=1 Tax=Winogradskyella algicola TaxID=2575815 RepID=UPI00110995C6|nr:hypothetical protein [Winogradskyella algicola]
MYIKIKLKQDGPIIQPIKFNILLDELKNALKHCYMELGTPYNPIRIDNFVTVGKNAFSLIDRKTKISISLSANSDDDLSDVIDYRLVCCKVINVDKTFINMDCLLNNHWGRLFKYNDDYVYSAPDGTLYIAPNKKEKCVISTRDSVHDANVSYSILLSLKVNFKNEKPRRFYLILDPLVKVSGGKGKIPPIIE